MPVLILTCRMGLYLYSCPINQFFKIKDRSDYGVNDLINEYSILSSTWNWFITILFFFIKKNTDSVVIFEIVFHCVYIVYIRLSFILYGVSIFDRRISFPFFTKKGSQPHFLEQLPLSLCTYPPFFFSLSEPLFVLVKQDLAQDCPFFIPGFLWIWKLSLSRFPYQGSIQLSP